MDNQTARLSVVGLGLACGVLWALSIFVVGMTAWLMNWGTVFVSSMGSMYIGYTHTFLGSILGAIWGFIDGFIGGALLAWFYNCFSRCQRCSKAD